MERRIDKPYRSKNFSGNSTAAEMTSLEARPLIERIRSKHEEIEKMEQSVMKVLESGQLSPTNQLLQGHRLRNMINYIIAKTDELVGTYAAFTDEMTRLSQQTETWTDVSSDFSYRLEQIHEYYGKHPSKRLFTADEALVSEQPKNFFNAAEGFGRYMDLSAMYIHYIDSNFGERVGYSAYLDVFSQPEKIPLQLKLSRRYIDYIGALLDYLIFFFGPTEPLQDARRILYKVEVDFKEQYADRKVEGLRNDGHENDFFPSHHTDMNTVEELIDMGPEKLNEETGALGLDTDGKRLFLTMSLMEAKVKKLCNILDEAIERTKAKEQGLAFEENPVKLEMGWDGKPIPYWLCKLGLGQEYKCEICSNYSYVGKRDFERHFKEWRHQVGLDCLGIIPEEEEKKFYGITLIEEAKKVWKEMKRQTLTHPHWQMEDDEEIKDEEAPVGVAIPPPNIRSMIERSALLVSIRGLEYEREIIGMYEEDDEELNFLKSPDDPYRAFYQHKLTEYKNQDATRILSDYDADHNLLGDSDECMVPPMRLEAHKFTCRVPERMIITHEDIDIIKLAAEFWVRYGGRCFFEGLSSDQLGFMNDPSDGRFSIFSRLVDSYLGVIKSKPKVMKEKLRNNAADIETVLENCYKRLQLDRFYKEGTWQRKANPPPTHKIKTTRFRPPPPPPPPPQKKLKIDESELVPEKHFLARHPGMAAIFVHVVKPIDARFEIFLPSLSESVASLKERMRDMFSVSTSKQEFSGKTGLLKDNMSLAYYNVGSGETLILSVG